MTVAQKLAFMEKPQNRKMLVARVVYYAGFCSSEFICNELKHYRRSSVMAGITECLDEGIIKEISTKKGSRQKLISIFTYVHNPEQQKALVKQRKIQRLKKNIRKILLEWKDDLPDDMVESLKRTADVVK